LSSYYLAKWTKNTVQWGEPITISFEPTTACNLRCPECPSGLRAFSRPTGNLKEDFFRQTIDSLHRDLLCLIFYFQGEPFINPKFLEMVAYAHEKGIYSITSTNGHFLNSENARKTVESGLDRLIISVDGTTQETYEAYRKEGNLETVLQGARNVVHWKKQLKSSTPHIIFQFLVVRPNEHQIPEIYQLAQEIGINEVKLKTAQVYDYERGNPLIPSIDRYARYAQKSDGTYQIKNKLLNHCWKLWHSCVITWDGVVANRADVLRIPDGEQRALCSGDDHGIAVPAHEFEQSAAGRRCLALPKLLGRVGAIARIRRRKRGHQTRLIPIGQRCVGLLTLEVG